MSWISRVPRTLFPRRRFKSHDFFLPRSRPSSGDPVRQVLGCREAWSWISSHHAHHQTAAAAVLEEQVDPFSLVKNELSIIGGRMRSMVAADVPELTSAAEYFFKSGVEGKKIRTTVLLLLAKSFDLQFDLATESSERQHLMAGVAEMIHVASLMHDDVLDESNTRRGVSSLNSVKGNKLAILAGDFVLSRAILGLAALKNTEAVSLMATVVSNLVTGETMQMKAAYGKNFSMEFYMQKTYNKTASLISNSCKAIAVLSGQNAEVSALAFDYGKNLGLAYQLIDDVLDFTGTPATLGKPSLSDITNGIITAPMLFAIEEFPELQEIAEKGFNDSANVDAALVYLRKSRGIEKTRELARKHSEMAAAAIDALPEPVDEDTKKARQALIRLTHLIITRDK